MKEKATMPRSSTAGKKEETAASSVPSSEATMPAASACGKKSRGSSLSASPLCGEEIKAILAEDDRRLAAINAKFNPITGEGSVGERIPVEIGGFPIPRQWIPVSMLPIPFVKKIIKAGSVDAFLSSVLKVEPDDTDRSKVIRQFVRLRCRHDFPFWAAMFVKIKQKGGGEDIRFRLINPQRRFVEKLEEKRLASLPIRLVLLKARQWGGSTTSQLYMAWLQLVHKVGLNSLIIAHQGAGSDEIKDMFDRMIKDYPTDMLYPMGRQFNPSEPKLIGVGKSGAIQRVPQRNCKIKIGTAVNPDSCRGGDYNLVHCSEVGIWKKTDGKSPEEIVASACTGVLYKPYTMIVYESTAKGSDNFFHREYAAAKKGESQFEAMFVSWFDIEWNTLPFPTPGDREAFAAALYQDRMQEDAPSDRAEPGKYLWWLWHDKGATLEAINWYVNERAGKPCHEVMASECPSDDIEAFVYSGANVFDRYLVEELRKTCRPPRFIGEVYADAAEGEQAMKNVRFKEDRQGRLKIWEKPDIDPDEIVTDRYLVVVDVGVGRTAKADNSVICVFDRIDMTDNGRPRVVAEWVGHIDMDLLAWKGAQIAAYYDNALLVIESNSLETHASVGAGTNHSGYILNLIKDCYDNLYSRRQSPEDIRDGIPAKYGFHTNVATKTVIIDGLIRAVRDKAYIEKSAECLDEYLTYVRTERGSFEASPGHHDDRLMTRAIGLHISFFEMDMPRFIERPRSSRRHRQPSSPSAAHI